jgi:hypothetical protein
MHAFGLALNLLVLLYLSARSRFGEGTVKTKERKINNGIDQAQNALASS